MNNNELLDAYMEVYNDLRHRIYNGELASMKEISHKVSDTYKENELLWENIMNNVYGETAMERDLLQVYVIHCSVENQVPVSGYEKIKRGA